MSFSLLLAVFASPPGWSTVAEFPAAQAVAHQDAIVTIAPDLLHIAAFTMTGAPGWRARYHTVPRGIQALQVRLGALLLFAGDKATRVDMKTGEAGAWSSVPAIGNPSAPGCWLNEAQGALGYMCPCSFQFARATGARVGDRFDFFRECRSPFDRGPPKCGCWGSSGTLIGRAGDLLIASVPTLQPPGQRARRVVWSQTLVAVSAKTGREVWRRLSPSGEPATYLNGVGVLPSGRGFWIADSRGQLAVFEAKSGRLRWQTPPSTKTEGASQNVWIAPLGGGSIFVATHETATALSTQTGKVLWQTSKGEDAVLPLAALDRPGGVQLRGTSQLRLLDDRTGAVVTTMLFIDMPARIERATNGELWMVSGTQLKRYTAAGRLLSQAAVAANSSLIRGETRVIAQTGDALQIFDARTLAPLGTLAGRYEVVQLEGPAGPGRLWLHDAVNHPNLKLIQVGTPTQ